MRNLKRRLTGWASLLIQTPSAPYDGLSDVAYTLACEQATAAGLRDSLNRTRAHLGLEDEIEDRRHDGRERLQAEDRYLLCAPVLAAMQRQIDELRAIVLFGDKP